MNKNVEHSKFSFSVQFKRKVDLNVKFAKLAQDLYFCSDWLCAGCTFNSWIVFQTPLHWAAKHGKPEVIKLLCGTHYADVNSRSVSLKAQAQCLFRLVGWLVDFPSFLSFFLSFFSFFLSTHVCTFFSHKFPHQARWLCLQLVFFPSFNYHL